MQFANCCGFSADIASNSRMRYVLKTLYHEYGIEMCLLADIYVKYAFSLVNVPYSIDNPDVRHRHFKRYIIIYLL